MHSPIKAAYDGDLIEIGRILGLVVLENTFDHIIMSTNNVDCICLKCSNPFFTLHTDICIQPKM